MTRKLPPAVSRTERAESAEPIIPRQFARVAVDLPAQYEIEGRSGWQSSVIDDLGGGGVRLQTEEDVVAGTVVFLAFAIEGVAITATARVAMSLYDAPRARFFHGVAFTAIDPSHQKAIVARVIALRGDDPV